MREELAIVLVGVVALMFGAGIGVAWHPFLSQYDNLQDDLLFAKIDVAKLSAENAELKKLAERKTAERDRAVQRSDEWQDWYESAHTDRTECTKQLSTARSELASANYQRSAQAQELVEIKSAAPVLKVVEYQPVKKRKPKPKKRKPVKVVYRWHLF